MIRNIRFFISLLIVSTVFASEADLYNFSWLDKDKEVYVLQNRKFRKKNTFQISAGYGKTISGAFVDASAIQVRGSYFFTEELGAEFIYSSNSGEENEVAASVRDTGSGGVIPFRRIVEGYYGGMLMWAPFYSKINTFNSIIYLDFLFGIGIAKLDESNNREAFDNQNFNAEDVVESHTGYIWNAGVKIYLTQNLNTRFDITAIHYQADRARQDSDEQYWYNNFDMTLALGYDF